LAFDAKKIIGDLLRIDAVERRLAASVQNPVVPQMMGEREWYAPGGRRR
jgi:hypothetical protein